MQRAQTPFFRVSVGIVDRPYLRSLRREQSNKLGSLEATRWSSCSSSSLSVFYNLVETETIDVRFHFESRRFDKQRGNYLYSPARCKNDQSGSLRISAYTARAMQQLFCVRSRQECACASEATLASPPRTHRCRCIRSRAPDSFGGLLQVEFLCRRPGCACS